MLILSRQEKHFEINFFLLFRRNVNIYFRKSAKNNIKFINTLAKQNKYAGANTMQSLFNLNCSTLSLVTTSLGKLRITY